MSALCVSETQVFPDIAILADHEQMHVLCLQTPALAANINPVRSNDSCRAAVVLDARPTDFLVELTAALHMQHALVMDFQRRFAVYCKVHSLYVHVVSFLSYTLSRQAAPTWLVANSASNLRCRSRSAYKTSCVSK